MKAASILIGMFGYTIALGTLAAGIYASINGIGAAYGLFFVGTLAIMVVTAFILHIYENY